MQNSVHDQMFASFIIRYDFLGLLLQTYTLVFFSFLFDFFIFTFLVKGKEN